MSPTTSNPVPSIESDEHETATPKNIPGSFPEEPAAVRSGETLVATAKSYLPAQDNVQHAMTSAGQTAKAYLPQGFAAYLPSASSEPSSDLTPPRPPFATHDRASAQKPKLAPSARRTLTPPTSTTSARSCTPAAPPPCTPSPRSARASRRTSSRRRASRPLYERVSPAVPPPPTSRMTDTERAGADVAAPSPYGVLAPSHPAEPPAAPAPAHTEAQEEGSPQRKPKLVQHLKEKMHVGHVHAHS
ncbi:hypothetical protein DFH09DRAFT_1373192 [Mycena vulgaris]|nr:hypothetical protein DFH09DRAFT_1373192 [Mycena vulgaris]